MAKANVVTQSSSYRPICQLDTMGDNLQFSFRAAGSIIDALIENVMHGKGSTSTHCGVITPNVENVFISAN